MPEEVLTARPINNASQFNSAVDIIVPFHGQYEKVTRLMESIFRLTRSNYYFLYVVDDCSENSLFIETLAANAQKNADRRKAPNILRTIRNDSQLGFAGACRVGYEAGTSPFVCFINSDCAIEDSGWLRTMGETLLRLKDQGVRMVAPMTNNPMGGHESQKGERFSRSDEDVILPDNAYLSMYCFLCHRELFARCGGFLKEYPYGFYEDEEFARRMGKYGFRQAVSRSSWVYHEGAATVRAVLRANPNVRGIMEVENRQRCIEDIKSLTQNPAQTSK